jgi:hypothetical protein
VATTAYQSVEVPSVAIMFGIAAGLEVMSAS